MRPRPPRVVARSRDEEHRGLDRGAALTVRCWGTRGSVPTPGPATARFGGNTPCLEVRLAGGRSLVFDAGTGIRLLGKTLPASPTGEPCPPIHLFLTHFHWDHIQGFPFFGPLLDPRARIVIHGPRQGAGSVEALLKSQMRPVFFPMPFERLPARLSYRHLREEGWEEDGVRVAAIRVRHPSRTVGYRVDSSGASVAYIPDNELGPFDGRPEALRRGYERFLAFLDGADLLLHDAMYTDEEYRSRKGWGHSSVGQAVRLARDAGVARLCLFHHAPDRSDDELARIVQRERSELAAVGSRLKLQAALEGEELMLGAPPRTPYGRDGSPP